MSPYAFYQFWLNRADEEMPGMLRVFSFKSREEIDSLVQEQAERPAARAGQRALADEVTTLVHGAAETAKAVEAGRALFGQGDLRSLDELTIAAAIAEVPHAEAGREPLTVADLMAASGIVSSKSAARRAIDEGGAYLNNVKVTDEKAVPAAEDYLHGRYLVLRRGKRTIGGIIRAK